MGANYKMTLSHDYESVTSESSHLRKVVIFILGNEETFDFCF